MNEVIKIKKNPKNNLGIILIIFFPNVKRMPIQSPNHADLELVKTVVRAIPNAKKIPEILPIFIFLFINMLARQNGHTRFNHKPA